MATGLRASDVARLTIRDIEHARNLGGYMVVVMQKTEAPAYCFLFPPVFESIDAYLQERKDRSPWLFIQHGRSGKKRQGTADYFASNTHKGYGAPISTTTVWRIVRSIATAAGYKESDDNLFLSPHAMRHWFAQSLRDADVPIDDIQSALGHASSETTKAIYAPLPNLKRLIQAQGEIQQASGLQTEPKD
jgi:integrase